MSAPASAFDPVAFIEKTIEDLNHNAAIAAEVACSARPQETLRAVVAMQTMVNDRELVLREIARMIGNPRIEAPVKDTIRQIARAGLATFARHIRRIESAARAWRTRSELIGRALQAVTTTHSVYTASGVHQRGVRLIQQTVCHAVTLSA